MLAPGDLGHDSAASKKSVALPYPMRARSATKRAAVCDRQAQQKRLVAEVGELERLTQIGTADQGDGLLQIIPLLTGHPHFVALNGGLYL